MKTLPLLLAGAGFLALAACGESKVETAEPEKSVSVAIADAGALEDGGRADRSGAEDDLARDFREIALAGA